MQPGFFKRNEKVIMVLLLAIIAPTFAFTGIMYSAFTKSDADFLSIFGEEYTQSRFDRMKARATNLSRLVDIRVRAAGDDETIRYIVFSEEARRLGIEVGDEELSEIVRERAIELIASSEVSNDQSLSQQQRDAALRARIPTTQYNEKAYKDALKRFYGWAPKQYEEAVREVYTIGKLTNLAGRGALVSNKEIYAEFEQQKQRRALDYVALPVSGFLEDARSKVVDAEIETRYADNPKEFEAPLQVALEAYKLQLVEFNAAHPTTEEEIVARYETDKIRLYRKDTAPTAAPNDPAAASDPPAPPAPEYKPIDEVRAEVQKSIEEQRELELLRKLNTEAMKQKSAGQTALDLEAALGENARFIEVIQTGLFSRNGVSTLPESIRNEAAMRSALNQVSSGSLVVGSYCARAVPMMDGGDFIYKVSEIRKESTPPLAECRELVREAIAKDKAIDFALETLAVWKKKIAANEGTLESLAAAGNGSIRSLPALQQSEATKALGADGKMIPGARDLLASAFEVAEVGALGEPVQPMGRADLVTDVFLVRLREIVLPDPLEFPAVRDQIERNLRARKTKAAQEEYISKLISRADIKELFERKPVEPPKDTGEDEEDDEAAQ